MGTRKSQTRSERQSRSGVNENRNTREAINMRLTAADMQNAINKRETRSSRNRGVR